jgi:hypothetical protein
MVTSKRLVSLPMALAEVGAIPRVKFETLLL